MQTPSSTPYLDNAYSRRGLSKFAMIRGVGQGAANAARQGSRVAARAGRNAIKPGTPPPLVAPPKPNKAPTPRPNIQKTPGPALSNHPVSVKPQSVPKPQDATRGSTGRRVAKGVGGTVVGGGVGLGANALLNGGASTGPVISDDAPIISDADTSGASTGPVISDDAPIISDADTSGASTSPTTTPDAEDVSVTDLLSDLGPQQGAAPEDNPSMRNYNQQQVDQAAEMAAAREEAGIRVPTLTERSEQNAVNRALEAGFERPTQQGFSSIGQAGQFNGLPEEIAGLPRRPFRMHSGQDLNAPPIGMSPSSPAEPTEDMLAAFQKFHATPFDPNSSMDRGKMAELQALADEGKSLTAANVYGNAMKAASNVLRFPRLTDLMQKEAGLGGALLGAGAGGALTDVAAPAVAEKIADLLHFIKHKGNTDDGSNSLKHVSRMIGGTTQNAYRDRAQGFLDKYSPAVTGAGALLGGLTGNAIQDRNEEEDEWTSYPAKRASVAMAMSDLAMFAQYAA